MCYGLVHKKAKSVLDYYYEPFVASEKEDGKALHVKKEFVLKTDSLPPLKMEITIHDLLTKTQMEHWY